jgi:hypothetical protein
MRDERVVAAVLAMDRTSVPDEFMSTDESRPTQLGRFCTNSNHQRS